MPNMVIDPRREKGEPQLPPVGIFVVNPTEAVLASAKAKAEGWRQHFLFNSSLYVVPDNTGSIFVAGPAVGAPMAVMALEKLIALGAKSIIAMGWCGSLTPSAAVGDIILPTSALSEEGTSVHYPLPGNPKSDEGLRQSIHVRLAKLERKIIEGAVWTTDAPYRENRDKVAGFSADGVLGVDMETSALCTVAAFRSVRLASVLLVSDETWREPWRPGFRQKGFKAKSRRLFEELLAICHNLAK